MPCRTRVSIDKDAKTVDYANTPVRPSDVIWKDSPPSCDRSMTLHSGSHPGQGLALNELGHYTNSQETVDGDTIAIDVEGALTSSSSRKHDSLRPVQAGRRVYEYRVDVTGDTIKPQIPPVCLA